MTNNTCLIVIRHIDRTRPNNITSPGMNMQLVELMRQQGALMPHLLVQYTDELRMLRLAPPTS